MIYSKTSTSVRGDAEYQDFLKRISDTKDAYVTIGLHEDAGQYPGENAPSVVEVGLWNEFGTATSPERSWLRSAIDEGQGQINQWRDEAILHIMNDGWTVEKALEMMGFRIQVLIQNKIKSDVPPSLADSTAKAKTASGVAPVTLIDTGLMLRSVTYKVHLG
jgi:hypothetical protein